MGLHNQTKRLTPSLLIALLCTLASITNAADSRPNILLIVADDMGFADLGSFGSEIDTPNLDRLAQAGTRFSQFQAAPTCSVTRSMLLTGVDSHKAGLGNMFEELSPNQRGKPGYEGYLNNRVVSVATLLREQGYHTYMTGKWHLGLKEDNSPATRGFEQSFALLKGGASHFDDMKPAYAPSPNIKAAYRDNGKLLSALPNNFHYSSQFYVDQMINYIDRQQNIDSPQGDKNRQPFFAYLAFTAPHWPLQAPKAAIEKYAGRYQAGYEQLAKKRLAKQKALGLLPASAALADLAPGVKAWQELSPQQQREQARAMEIYAAMVDQLDYHTGRLIDHLKKTGQFENTVIIFLSDNGAEGHDLDQTWPAELFPDIRRTIDQNHDFSFANMGDRNSYSLYGGGWARAGAPGFRLYKGFPTEGGTHVPAFMVTPQQPRGAINHTLVSVKDITPTLLELAGIQHPGTQYKGKPIEAMSGRSMMPLLTSNNSEQQDNRIIAGELMGKRSLRSDHWKLVHIAKPYGNNQWQLYNLANDPAEQHDLSMQQADRKRQLLRLWDSYEQDNNIIYPDWVSGY
jgi:arylsulfatase